jgi:hypothetical protein
MFYSRADTTVVKFIDREQLDHYNEKAYLFKDGKCSI